MTLLLMHLQAADRFGASVREAERAALAQALGRAPDDFAEAEAALAARVVEPPDERWIRFFAERGTRRLALWPYLAGLAAKPLARLEDAG